MSGKPTRFVVWPGPSTVRIESDGNVDGRGTQHLAFTISELQAQLERDHAWRAITA